LLIEKEANAKRWGQIQHSEISIQNFGRQGLETTSKETLMGMFDGLLGGIVGAGMVTVVNGIIEKHGGLQGLVSEFERNGLGNTVKSWVGTGPNQPISTADVQRALGPDLLQQLSAKSGLSVQDLTDKLAQVLPQAVDRMTPGGSIPKS
jgi:uncharacterized protein YidB (DUF937 family)